jgi:CheY-like chemotaxis protein
VSVLAVTQRVVDHYHGIAAAKGLTLQIEARDPSATVMADDSMLADILGYLVDNAIKYTREGGVVIRTSYIQEGETMRGRIDVQDTGIGIPKEHFETIFKEFKQISEGYGRDFEGSGVGLTVARKMTEILGGQLRIESEVGKGSTFSVLLLVPPGQMETDDTAKPETRHSNPEHRSRMPDVLIVEDNFINKAVIAEFLKTTCRIEHARDGETAVQMARQKKYDAILMDINLGKGPDGIQTTKAIRRLQGYEGVPIVAVTGYAHPGDKERLLTEGMNLYLPKPFDQHDIVEVVRKALG